MDKKLQKQLLDAQMRTNQQAALQGNRPAHVPPPAHQPPHQTQQIRGELSLAKRDTFVSLFLIALVIVIFVGIHYADRQYGFLTKIGNWIFGLLR